MATDTGKRLAGPTLLSASAATVYTVPGSTTATIRDIHVCNETGTAATFTLSIGTDAAGKRLYMALPVPGNSAIQRTGNIVLTAAEILQAYSGTASALTLTITGIETA